jgi:hypothetical protein
VIGIAAICVKRLSLKSSHATANLHALAQEKAEPLDEGPEPD